MVPLTSPGNIETKYEVSQASLFSTYKIFSSEMFGKQFVFTCHTEETYQS